MKLKSLTVVVGLCFAVFSFAAITIDEGPVWVPPGAGTESYSDPFTPGKSTGATVYQTGYDLGQTENLWFGIKVDTKDEAEAAA